VSGEWYSKSEDHNSKEFGPRFLWDGRIGCLLKGSDTTIPKNLSNLPIYLPISFLSTDLPIYLI
jgi:hypothetical protein